MAKEERERNEMTITGPRGGKLPQWALELFAEREKEYKRVQDELLARLHEIGKELEELRGKMPASIALQSLGRGIGEVNNGHLEFARRLLDDQVKKEFPGAKEVRDYLVSVHALPAPKVMPPIEEATVTALAE